MTRWFGAILYEMIVEEWRIESVDGTNSLASMSRECTRTSVGAGMNFPHRRAPAACTAAPCLVIAPGGGERPSLLTPSHATMGHHQHAPHEYSTGDSMR